MAHERADLGRLRVRALAERQSKHTLDEILIDPGAMPPDCGDIAPAIERVAGQMERARDSGASIILAYGAHLVKNGLALVVGRLIESGWITHLATNGAGVIHDWEYSFQGKSEEDVRHYVARGQFGAWDETGRYTLIAILAGALQSMGYGESIGRFIVDDGCRIAEVDELRGQLRQWIDSEVADEVMPAVTELLQVLLRGDLQGGTHAVPHPYKSSSLTAQATRLSVPLTVHPGIGYDIIYNHPMANGAALGRAAHVDYLTLVHSVSRLEASGVVLSVGSAIMAPQVMEKAVSAANNMRLARGQQQLSPLFAVNDLVPSQWDWSTGEPPADHPAYYTRFCKSFSRLGGEMIYIGADNRVFLQNLLSRLG